MTHKEVLENTYKEALKQAGAKNVRLSEETRKQIGVLASHSEKNKGLTAVLVTLMTHKVVCPEQDIRLHQAKMDGGFSGRTIDTTYITPFLKSVSFPSMASSGWLTRSLEQNHPYTLDYPGAITPAEVKQPFLQVLDKVQNNKERAQDILRCFFCLLIEQRDRLAVEIAKPHILSISAIIKLLEKHFSHKYSGFGASRLPTLAVYAAYQCMIEQMERYKGKSLCPLESHTSADTRSGRIGDIDVNNDNGEPFEGVEIKYGIKITAQLVMDAYEKFKSHHTDRYYLLTTANMDNAEWDLIDEAIQRIANIHGCQVIVNGVYSSLKYYLRIINDPAEFIDKYVELLKNDKTIKFEHKAIWNDLVNANA